ncbi:MAG: hypothetical protein U5O39_11885 [Gammaproteobacteria bacterium]|nr:hypothetical protein [Gammaproteobacteria bacterium]
MARSILMPRTTTRNTLDVDSGFEGTPGLLDNFGVINVMARLVAGGTPIRSRLQLFNAERLMPLTT